MLSEWVIIVYYFIQRGRIEDIVVDDSCRGKKIGKL